MNSSHRFPSILLVALATCSMPLIAGEPDIVWQADAGLALAFAPNSTLLVTGNQLRNASDGALVASYLVHPIGNGVGAAAVSPDGSYVALGIQTFNQNLDVYDALSGSIVRTRVTAHENGTTAVAFSPDGQWLASGGRDGTAKLWRLPDVTLTRTFGNAGGYNPRVFAIAFSRDGASIAVGGEGGVQVFALVDGSVLQTVTDVSTASLAYSPDGAMLASGSNAMGAQGQCADCTIKLWDAADGTLIRTLQANDNGAGALAFSPDASTIAVGSGDHIFDGLVRFFRVADGTLLDSFAETNAYVTDVAYSPDGTLFAFSRSDAEVIVARNPGAACDVVLTPPARNFAVRGGTGAINVEAAPGCAWQAGTDASWVHVTAGTGTASGTVNYRVDADTSAPRDATIVIAGHVHAIHQQGASPTGRLR